MRFLSAIVTLLLLSTSGLGQNTQPPSAESSSLEERVAAIEDRLGKIEELLRQMDQRSSQPDPELVDPVIAIDYNENNNITRGVSASDITVLRKHILGFNTFESQEKLIAADVNGDNRISSIDIITLRKVILGFDLVFPNEVRSYTPDQNNIPVLQDPGGEIRIPVKMIKMGDLN